MQVLPIKFLTRQQIEADKWDHCIATASNGLPYVMSYFLDKISPGWSALIAGDYELVMPLTWKRKWGIDYLTQPPFVQQTGVFSNQLINDEQLALFLSAVKKHFRFAEIFLNYQNEWHEALPRQNFMVDLNSPYQTIKSKYKNVLLKNLKVASKHGLLYSIGDVQQSVDMYRQEYTSRLPHVKPAAYKAFEEICAMAAADGNLVVRSAINTAGKILSSVVLVSDKRRLVLLISVTNASGRKVQANHYLLDRVIREYAGQPLFLDFEGSEVPGIAAFYKSFGAFDQPYFFYRYNRLPALLRVFKK